MERPVAIYFRDRFRAARAAAQMDSEDFAEIIFALEQLGTYLCKGKGKGLWDFEDAIFALACKSSLAKPTDQQRPFGMPFQALFESVRKGRNSAMHEGAFARHLTQHAIEISIVLEDALNQIIHMPDPTSATISDFMVHNPVCAEMWQPLSFVRQNMLANSFSYLPVKHEGKWRLISDLGIVLYVKCNGNRLSNTLQQASAQEPDGLKFSDAVTIKETAEVEAALEELKSEHRPPVLLITRKDSDEDLRGIVTAFDLL